MINAGRILIVPKGDWNNLDPYEMLDLVTYSKTAYIARKASVGVNPQTDVQQEYWQPFGTAVEIATTDKPGIVMPDGTTITISQTGLIEAHLSLDDLSNVDIVNPTNGQVLAFSSILNGWQSQSLGTAALKDSSNAVTEDSTDLVESGAVYDEIDTLKQTLENEIDTVSAQVSDNDDAYSLLKPYKVGALCIHDNKLYRCITACSAAAWSVNSSCFTQTTLANAVDKLNSYLSNNFGAATVISLSTPYTCPSDGWIKFGAYGATAVILSVNEQRVGAVYGGGQTNATVFNTYKVRKGDIVTVNYAGTASEANTHHFYPYN